VSQTKHLLNRINALIRFLNYKKSHFENIPSHYDGKNRVLINFYDEKVQKIEKMQIFKEQN
jgi:hypothetical protein